MHHGWHTPPLNELDGVACHAAPSPASRHRLGFVGEIVRGVIVTCFIKLCDEALVPGKGDHVAVEIVRVES